MAAGISLIALVVYISAQRFAEGTTAPHTTVPGEEKPWKIEVVNIAGEDGLASRMTRYLRSLGYDVVEFHSRQLAGYERTMLIDRTGNPAAAQDIAATLGLDAGRIATELDRSLYVDVTVVLGFDYKTIQSLRHLERKDTP